MRSLLLGVLLAMGLLGPAHAAITFNFSWVNGGYSASGVMTINKSAGEAFATSDNTGTNITVSGPGQTPFTFTTWNGAAGSIATDGLSASFSAATTVFYFSGNKIFGCLSPNCGFSADTGFWSFLIKFGANSFNFNYGSQSELLSSFKLTAVPLPAALPMAAVAFGGLAALSRRRRGTDAAARA